MVKGAPNGIFPVFKYSNTYLLVSVLSFQKKKKKNENKIYIRYVTLIKSIFSNYTSHVWVGR